MISLKIKKDKYLTSNKNNLIMEQIKTLKKINQMIEIKIINNL